jgi:predicted ATPase
MAAHKKQDIEFTPSLQLIGQARATTPYTALSGPNNSGKSLTLRSLKQTLGKSAYFVGTNRFYHVYHLSTQLRQPNELDQFESAFQSQFNDESHNHEQNAFDLARILASLSDKRRNDLFGVCGELIESKFSLRKVEDDNELSPRYVDMDGQNLSVASTGTRLLMTILGICMDDRFKTILIDEPELGLSPRVQGALSNFLQDETERKKYFPNLDRVFVATHSHLFLSRSDIASNYVVTKGGTRITLNRVQTIGDFHRLQFNLLGNSLESLFFPSAIMVVEGKTDFAYVDRLIALHYAGNRVAVLSGNGDVKKKIHALRELLGDISKSPLRERIFIVIDSVHPQGLKDELERMGIPSDNVVIWPKNGIEHYYPVEIMTAMFSCDIAALDSITISGDAISINGISKTKNELSMEVIRQLTASTPLHSELSTRLLSPLSKAIS